MRVRLLNVLAAAALKDDVILLLHQDRREHVLMNYAHDVDRLSQPEQESLALFVSISIIGVGTMLFVILFYKIYS